MLINGSQVYYSVILSRVDQPKCGASHGRNVRRTDHISTAKGYQAKTRHALHPIHFSADVKQHIEDLLDVSVWNEHGPVKATEFSGETWASTWWEKVPQQHLTFIVCVVKRQDLSFSCTILRLAVWGLRGEQQVYSFWGSFLGENPFYDHHLR